MELPDGRYVELRYASNRNPSVRYVTSQGTKLKRNILVAPSTSAVDWAGGAGNVYEGARDVTKERPPVEDMKRHLAALKKSGPVETNPYWDMVVLTTFTSKVTIFIFIFLFI